MKIKTILIILQLHSTDIVEIKTDTWHEKKEENAIEKPRNSRFFHTILYEQIDGWADGETARKTDR